MGLHLIQSVLNIIMSRVETVEAELGTSTKAHAALATQIEKVHTRVEALGRGATENANEQSVSIDVHEHHVIQSASTRNTQDTFSQAEAVNTEFVAHHSC